MDDELGEDARLVLDFDQGLPESPVSGNGGFSLELSTDQDSDTRASFALGGEPATFAMGTPEIAQAEIEEDCSTVSNCEVQGGSSGLTVELPDEDSAPGAQQAGKWAPGYDVGRWVCRLVAPLTVQSQVLVTNVVLASQRVPKIVCRQITNALGVVGSHRTSSIAIQVASALLRLPATTITCCERRVRCNAWQPVDTARAPPADAPQGTRGTDKEVLTVLVREVLAAAYKGRSQQDFTEQLARYSLAGVDIGDKYMSRNFAREVEFLGARVLENQVALDLGRPLLGTGLRSDIGLFWDFVSIGGAGYPRHETVNMIAIGAVSTKTGRLFSQLLAAPTVPIGGHTGASQRDQVFYFLLICAVSWLVGQCYIFFDVTEAY